MAASRSRFDDLEVPADLARQEVADLPVPWNGRSL
jgi:hypothetical protein